jgi:hypothetical protein
MMAYGEGALAAGTLLSGGGGGKGGISAYHGSPHSFGKFSVSKIGTGEGAQAFGHGLYFAEHPDVAKNYAEVGGTQYKYQGQSLQDWLKGKPRSNLEMMRDPAFDNKNIHEITQEFEKIRPELNAVGLLYDYGPHAERMSYSRDAETQKALKGILQSGQLDTGPSHLYQVNLKPEPHEWLDWEKPLSEQSQHVQDALVGFRDKLPNVTADTPGKDIYRDLSENIGGERFQNPAEASAALHQMGVRGVRYPDAFSRQGEDVKTHNYVVFHPDDIEITHKNGEIFNAAGDSVPPEGYRHGTSVVKGYGPTHAMNTVYA